MQPWCVQMAEKAWTSSVAGRVTTSDSPVSTTPPPTGTSFRATSRRPPAGSDGSVGVRHRRALAGAASGAGVRDEVAAHPAGQRDERAAEQPLAGQREHGRPSLTAAGRRSG